MRVTMIIAGVLIGLVILIFIAGLVLALVGDSQQNAPKVQIIRDKRSADAAGVGYLSLRTVNPSSAAVYEGGVALGSTPLTSVPFSAGIHKLSIIDGDSKHRMLSVSIESGKTQQMKAVDVQSLPIQ